MKTYNLFAALSLCASTLCAQEIKTTAAVRLNTVPAIDGHLSDSCWQALTPLKDFTTSTPVFGKTPHCPTEVRIFYTETDLYLAAWCFDPGAASVRNDGGIRDGVQTGDWFQLSLDTWRDGQLAFDFTVTAAGVQADARQSNGNWNARWQSAVRMQADGWTLEMRIPFAALRYPKNKLQQDWGLQLTRYDRSTGETSTWNPQQPLVQDRVWQFGALEGLTNIHQTRRRSLSLYSNTSYSTKVALYPGHKQSWWETVGLDGTLGLGPNATLDATLLPPLAINVLENYPGIYGRAVEGNAALPEPRQLAAEESDLFERGPGVTLNPVVVAYNLRWRIEPLPMNSRWVYSSNSTLLQATKLSIRTDGNWRFGIYTAALGPAKELIRDGDTEYTETLQGVSWYNYFTGEYLLRNNSYINFSNAVLLAGPAMNTVLPSLNWQLRDRKNAYEFSGSGRLSFQHVDSVRQSGGAINLSLARVNKRWGWRLDHKGDGPRYQPYLLSRSASNGPVTSARITYQSYTPFGPFININSSAGGSVEYAWFAGERTDWLLNADAQALGRHFWRYALGMKSIPYGRIINHSVGGIQLKQKVSPFVSGYLDFTTDTRRRAYCQLGLEAGAGIDGEYPEVKTYLAPAWVLNRWLSAELSTEIKGQLQVLEPLRTPGRLLFRRWNAWQYSGAFQLNWYPLRRLQLTTSANLFITDNVKEEIVELQPDGKLVPITGYAQKDATAPQQTLMLGLQYFFSSNSQIRFQHTFTLGNASILAVTPNNRWVEQVNGGRSQLIAIFYL